MQLIAMTRRPVVLVLLVLLLLVLVVASNSSRDPTSILFVGDLCELEQSHLHAEAWLASCVALRHIAFSWARRTKA
jgi:hypothetical protein